MKKILILPLIALLVTAILLAGCGKPDGDKSAEEAKKLLADSQEKMNAVGSMKMTGSTTVEMTEAEQDSGSYEFEMVTRRTPDGQTELQMVGGGEGEEVRMFVLDGYMYTYDSNSGWAKTKVTGEDSLGTTVPTPDQLSEMSEYAENLRMLPGEEGKYVVAFDVSPDFFGKYSEGLTDPSGILKEYLKDIEVSVTYGIDRSTMYADNVDVDLFIKGIPMFGDIDGSISITFSEFDQPVDIVLPADALNAPEKELLPGDIPSIPGLGL